jgi:hypothetical protein
MSGAQIAMAALGFAGCQAASFVLAPRTTPTSGAPARGVLRAAQQSNIASTTPPVASTFQAMLCSSVTAGLVGAAAANQKRSYRSRMAAAMDPTEEVGAMAPVGYWDPCGMMKERVGMNGWQWKDEKAFEKYRVAELKHGRVGMLAATGMLVNIVWKWEGFGKVPQGWEALQSSKGGAGFGLLVILASYFELTNPKGDFTDPFGFGSKMDEDMDVLRKKELNNGRIGMIAAFTLIMYNVFEKKTPAMMVSHSPAEQGAFFAENSYLLGDGVAFLPALFTVGILALPLLSENFDYEPAPAEINARLAAGKPKAELPEATKTTAEPSKATDLPEATPVTIKAELNMEAPSVAAKEAEDLQELSTSDADRTKTTAEPSKATDVPEATPVTVTIKAELNMEAPSVAAKEDLQELSAADRTKAAVPVAAQEGSIKEE